MPQLSRLQLLVYGALAVAVLLIGARWIQSGQPGEGGHSFDFTSAEGVASGGAPVQEGSTEAHAFSVEGQSGDVVVHVRRDELSIELVRADGAVPYQRTLKPSAP